LERAYVLDREGRPESEVPLLALLSKPMQRDLHFARYEGCLREIGFSQYLSHASGHGPAELLALRHLATHAISQTTLAAGDAVFEAGTVARQAFFLAQGRFDYAITFTQNSCEEKRWVSEMTLWTPWLHLGELTTREESGIVSLQASGFFDCMRRWWNLFEMAQTYAREYVKAMGAVAAVTDLWDYHVDGSMSELDSLRSSSSFPLGGQLHGPRRVAWEAGR